MAKERGKTLVIVEHALEEILPLVERVLIMDKGQIIRDGTVEEILKAGDIKGVFRRPDVVRLAESIRLNSLPMKPEDLSREIYEHYKPKKLENVIKNERTNGFKTPIIHFDTVSYTYQGDQEAITNVTLTIYEGEFVALMGRNGSGKTTLVSHIIGLLKPDEGKVMLAGHDTRETPTHILAKDVGFCFQNPNHQIVSFNVRDEMTFGLKAHNIDPSEYESRIMEALKIVNMQDFLDAEIFDLGKGQKQRIALASVLTLKPKILVIDEPTTGQDPEMAHDIFKIIKKLNDNGTTVICITHNVELAALFAHRAIVLNHGKVAYDGSISDLMLYEELMQSNSLELPDITKLAKQLSPLGIPANTVRFADMKSYLEQIVEA